MTYNDLKNYRRIARRVRQLEQDIERLAARMEYVSPVLSFAGGGGGSQDKLAEQVIKLIEIKAEYAGELAALYLCKHDVDVWIAALPEQQAKIARCRYIDGMSWRGVARASNYSVDHCFTLNRKLCRRLER